MPAHYPIVGRHLLGAIQHVLGDAATPALMAAWDEAYWLLAGELIAAEARLYQTVGQAPGALQTLRVVAREDDSANVVSWYLQTADGRSPGAFVPGQYVSVAVQFDHPAVRQLRQYSLSDHPAQPHWRITVKREAGQADTPAGRVSNWLHSHLHVGDSLPVSAAFGDFQPQLDGDTPLVLMSAGVGVTPMTAVLASLAAQGSTRPLHWLHACRDGQHQVLRSAIDQAAAQLPQLQRSVWYETPQASDQQGKDYQHAGRMLLDGECEVNEVFFDNVEVPAENLIGEENKGWTYAKHLLSHERTNIADVNRSKRELERLKRIAKTEGMWDPTEGGADAVRFRDQIALLEVDIVALEMLVLRVLSAEKSGKNSLDIAGLLKIKGSEIQQRYAELMMLAAGPFAMPFIEEAMEAGWQGNFPGGITANAPLASTYFNLRKTTIYGGSNEVQRNIVAQTVLG